MKKQWLVIWFSIFIAYPAHGFALEQKPPSRSELSKLLYLVKRISQTNAKVIYSRREYETRCLAFFISSYISVNYKNEKAEDWIKANAYRAKRDGSLIYIKYPNGESRLAKDLLLEELRVLPSD